MAWGHGRTHGHERGERWVFRPLGVRCSGRRGRTRHQQWYLDGQKTKTDVRQTKTGASVHPTPPLVGRVRHQRNAGALGTRGWEAATPPWTALVALGGPGSGRAAMGARQRGAQRGLSWDTFQRTPHESKATGCAMK